MQTSLDPLRHIRAEKEEYEMKASVPVRVGPQPRTSRKEIVVATSDPGTSTYSHATADCQAQGWVAAAREQSVRGGQPESVSEAGSATAVRLSIILLLWILPVMAR